MEGSIPVMLLLQFFLILLNAVFACAEIAVISMNDNKLNKMAAEGDKRAVRLTRLTSQPARFLATIQVAITLSGFLGSAFAAENFADRLVNWLIGLGVGVPVKTLNTLAIVVITIVLSYFTLVLGELVPKRVAMRKAEQLALGLSGLISFISTIFAPIVTLLTASTNGMLRLFGIDPNAQDEEVSEEEIRMMVDVGSEKGAIGVDEKEFIQNVFEFDDMTAGEIATHRTEVTILWMDESMEQWADTLRKTRHALYPVCDETVDNVIGVLSARDYFCLDDISRENVMKNAVKPAYFVPESVKADVLFCNMKRKCSRFSVVLDEYGGVSGIITMNDLIEQLVGEIEDGEADAPAPDIERVDGKTWRILGSAPLDDVSKALEVKLPDGEYDTFGGLIFSELGAIPEDGSVFDLEIGDLSVKVTEVADHRIEKTLVCRTETHKAEE